MAPPPRRPAPGLPARLIAAEILENVLRRKRPLDGQLDGHPGLGGLADRDRALARRLVATVLRRLGTLRHLLNLLLEHGFPREAPRVETALLIGAAQVLWLDVPNHAAVDLAVESARADRQAMHYAKLVNAVLRRVAASGAEQLAGLDTVALDTPKWLFSRWIAAYGEETARAIAAANGEEPALDFTVKENPQHWADVLQGLVLPAGSVRAVVQGPIPALPGYAEGAWWVQDAAAALPVRLFGDLRGKTVADLCAAPGGKTTQLAVAGAHVVAVDRSETRLKRLHANLQRLDLTAETVAADVEKWEAPPFDAVLLDAPCSSTGTIRRHPDIPWLKSEADINKLSALQKRLITRAAELTKPGGLLIYCTCSLEPEEGVAIVDGLLALEPRMRRRPISPAEVGGLDQVLTPQGDLRTLPCHLPDPDPRLAGLDGFYAARLERL